MDWRLRPALAADAEALSLVAGATLLESFHAIIPGADLVEHVRRNSSSERFAEWIADRAGTMVLLAEHGRTGAPLGYAVTTAPDFPLDIDADDLELRRIYVLAGWHGAGIGPGLLDSAVLSARARGVRRLLLGVHHENSRARRFYERSGFRVIGRRPFLVGATVFDDPVYALAL
jgi:diamine N-acetyltransferase